VDAELFYRLGDKDTFWAKLGHSDQSSINTYPSHIWVLKTANGEELKTWTITSSDPPEQEYVV